MKINRILALGLAALMALSFSACGKNDAAQPSPSEPAAETSTEATEPSPTEETEEAAAPTEEPQERVRVLSFKGPTGMGMAGMMEKYQDDSIEQLYRFELVSAPDEAVAALTSGSADIAALPSNLGATLYNKTNGEIQVLAVNALSNLYILSDDESIKSIADLSGKTLHATGQGATPEYIVDYLLKANGVTDCKVEWHAEHSELATLMASGEVMLGLLPEPFVEIALVKNEALKVAIDIGAEWSVQQPGSPLPMGVVVVRKEFAMARPEAVEQFLKEYEQSILDVNADPKSAGAWIAGLGILDNADIATAAIPKSGIVFLREAGEFNPGMLEVLTNYFQVLFDANPKSIGGKMPGYDFYFGVALPEEAISYEELENSAIPEEAEAQESPAA